MLLVALDPAVRFFHTRNAWMLRTTVVTVAAAAFALYGSCALSSSTPFIFKLLLLPAFNELGRGGAGKVVDFVSFIAFYFSVVSWALANSMLDDSTAKLLDDVTLSACWACVAFFSPSIISFDAAHESIGRAAVYAGCAVVAAARFWPAVTPAAVLFNVLASYVAVQVLAAAQADEDGRQNSVRIQLLLGFVPRVAWTPKLVTVQH